MILKPDLIILPTSGPKLWCPNLEPNQLGFEDIFLPYFQVIRRVYWGRCWKCNRWIRISTNGRLSKHVTAYRSLTTDIIKPSSSLQHWAFVLPIRGSIRHNFKIKHSPYWFEDCIPPFRNELNL